MWLGWLMRLLQVNLQTDTNLRCEWIKRLKGGDYKMITRKNTEESGRNNSDLMYFHFKSQHNSTIVIFARTRRDSNKHRPC